ncbi:MAG: TonB-dependent receptor [Vicingaceae bacterium]|nr:TonB-dependent receptor [Vicingaceae bacterium]
MLESKVPAAYKSTQLDSSATRQAVNLSELLNSSSPVFVKTYGSGSLASVSFRGTGANHTSVLWNGVTLNSPMNGQVDFSLFPTPFIDDATLYHGASGLINGSGALGGSVELNNATSFNRGFSTTMQQSIGSFGNYISNAKISYSNQKWLTETQFYFNTNKNNFEFTNVAFKEQPRITQQNANLKQYGLQQAIYRHLKNNKLGVRFWYFNSNRELPTSMLSMLNDDVIPANETQQDESYRVMLEWSGFTSKLNYRITSAYLKDKLIYKNNSSSTHSTSNTEVFDNKLNTSTYLNYNFTLKNVLSVRYEQAKTDGFNQSHSRFNNYWLLGIDKQIKRLNLSVFNRTMMVSDEVQMVAPSLGVLYGLTKGNHLKIKANAAINYNYPTFNDLYWSVGGNEDLQQEKAEMVELGASYKAKIRSTVFTNEVTAFYSHVYDWIIWLPTNINIWSPTNLREVENKGIEYSLKLNTTYQKLKIKFNGNYAYTISTNRKAKNYNDNSVNKQLIYVPYHQINYTLELSLMSFQLSYNYNYIGRRFMSTDNNWYLPANYISNVSIAKDFKVNSKTKLNGSLKVNNIFNQDYQAIAWRAMPGRNYLFTLSFQFN